MAGPLIAVWSPKGGVGKTVIAAGLAMHLMRRCPGGVILVDLDAGKADVAPLLKTSLRPSILEYPTGEGRTVVHPAGLKIIPGPPRLVDEGLVTSELAEATLRRAVGSAGAVVVDLDTALRDSTVVALEQADAVLLVTTPDLLSIYAARRFTQEAPMIGVPLGKFRLVINQALEQQEIPDAEILSLVGLGPAGRIPRLPGLAASINRGMTSSTLRSGTDFSLAIHLISDRLDFAGLPRSAAGAYRARISQNVGVLPALKRWWRSL